MFKKVLCGIALFASISTAANAALISRLSGAAYYDTVLNITWLADANYAYTSGFDGNGLQQWGEANNYVAWLNTNNHLGSNTWRLPTIVDSGALGCQFTYNNTDCGYNVNLNTSEMAHLFYSTLGNVGYYDTSGVATGCSVTTPLCLTNTGPFSNVDDYYYWSGTAYAPSPTQAWYFGFGTGSQNYNPKTSGYRAWAVMSGDIAPVPVPAAVWLFGGALAGLGVLRRRQAAA